MLNIRGALHDRRRWRQEHYSEFLDRGYGNEVLSTNITGIPEIVEDGVSGILVPPDDENALSEALIKLIENHDLREKLGENARKKVEERFDINKNIVKYIALFEGSTNAVIQKRGLRKKQLKAMNTRVGLTEERKREYSVGSYKNKDSIISLGFIKMKESLLATLRCLYFTQWNY